MVDAVHVACAGADQVRDRQAGTEADLKDLVGGPHTEQRDHPAAALPIGRAMGHLPGGHAPGRAPRMMGLADDVVVQDAHGGDPGTRDPVDITQCPNFNAGITARLAGQPLSRSHQQLHGRRSHEVTDSF
jgi:hypothetical protein